jgi:hypothetical protein
VRAGLAVLALRQHCCLFGLLGCRT